MASLTCWANGASSWPGHFSSPAHGLSSSSRLTFLHGGLRAEFQKGKGRSCKALWRTVSTTQNSYTVAPTTFYKSKQLTVQPRLKRWGNRLHLLTDGITKKLWQYSISHRKFLACICINGRYKGALSIAAPRGTQHIIRNLSLHLLACFILCWLYSQASFSFIVTKWPPTTINLHPHNVSTLELLFPNSCNKKSQNWIYWPSVGHMTIPDQRESTHSLTKLGVTHSPDKWEVGSVHLS